MFQIKEFKKSALLWRFNPVPFYYNDIRLFVMVKKMIFFICLVFLYLTNCTSREYGLFYSIGDTIIYEDIESKLVNCFFSKKYKYLHLLYASSRDRELYCYVICDTNNVIVDVLLDNPDIFTRTYIPDVITIQNDTIYSISDKKIDESHVFPDGICLVNRRCSGLSWETVFVGNVREIDFSNDSISLQLESCYNCQLTEDTLVKFAPNSISEGGYGLCSRIILDEDSCKKGNSRGKNLTYLVSDSIMDKYKGYVKRKLSPSISSKTSPLYIQ